MTKALDVFVEEVLRTGSVNCAEILEHSTTECRIVSQTVRGHNLNENSVQKERRQWDRDQLREAKHMVEQEGRQQQAEQSRGPAADVAHKQESVQRLD